MQLSDLNPHIRYARVHKGQFCWVNRENICYDCHLIFCDHASGVVTIFDKKYEISNKTVIYLPPKSQYSFDVDFRANSKAIALNFDLKNDYGHICQPLGTATVESFDESLVPLYSLPEELKEPIVRNLPELEAMLTQCTDNFLLNRPFYRENSSALLKLCLLELIHRSRQSSRSRICEEVLDFVKDHYANTELTNGYIADVFHYTPDHLSSLIRQETGKSLHQHLICYRLQMAKNLLITTSLDVGQIAEQSGFQSSAYFIKLFREYTGVTPKTYRRMNPHTGV